MFSFSQAKRKLKATFGPRERKLGFEEAQTTLSIVSSRSNLATASEAGLEKPLEVLLSSSVNAEWMLIESRDRFRNIKSNLARASGIKHTMTSGTRKGNFVEAFEKILVAETDIGPIILDNGDTSKMEKQMSALVDKKLAAINKKQWRVKVCGRSVEVREQVDRIVKVVLVAKNFVSPVASIDPVHAGLPWAGVCMLLPVSDL
jgi:N-terminal domain of NWD NACHT-NTPase